MTCSAHADQGSWLRPNARALVHRAGGTLLVPNQTTENSRTISALLWPGRRRDERSGTENMGMRKQERYVWAVFSEPSAPKGQSLPFCGEGGGVGTRPW